MPALSLKRLWQAAALALAATLVAGAATAEPAVWVVRDKDSELVLFGSVHVLPPGLGWRPPALTRALPRADDLWFELPIDAQAQAATARLAARQGGLPPGQNLFDLLGPKDAARLQQVAQAYDVAPEMLAPLKPWLAEVVLAAAVYRRAGADAQSGVEQTVAAAAPAGAALRAFESPTQQIQVLAGGALDDQLASLRETLTEMEDQPDAFQVLLKAWLAGDVKALEREALEPLRKGAPGAYRRLVTERNARWTEALRARLAGSGRTVVVVGVGHLIGPDGLPARLRALGYAVSGP